MVHVDAGGDEVAIGDHAVPLGRHEGDHHAAIGLGERDGAVEHAAAGYAEDDVLGADTESDPAGALREDPDAILVGELRDLETMSIAMTVAEMGVRTRAAFARRGNNWFKSRVAGFKSWPVTTTKPGATALSSTLPVKIA